MVDYREILRISSDPQNSQRDTERIVRISRYTISSVLAAAKGAGIQWPLDESVTKEMLKEMLFPIDPARYRSM